ncbi:MAG: TonB-dependent receptor [Rhodobacterales bacterium]|nr:TonB-dependent receptor [Rhodobacterales bacterium]
MTHNWPLKLLALAMLLPTAAYADPKDDARRHFAAGLEAAHERDFDIALQRFLAAQEAYPHSATLYNIAQTYQNMDDFTNSLIYYRLYSDAAPAKASAVDPIIAAMEARNSAPEVGPRAPTATEGSSVSDNLGAMEIGGANQTEVVRLEELASEIEAITRMIEARGGSVTTTGGEVPDPEVKAGPLLNGAYDKIVVTASRVGQDPLDSPSTLTVLTSEDIRMSGAQTVPDLLRRVAGVDVMVSSAGHSDVSIRGFNRKVANKVLVLIDGRSTYSDFIGASFPSIFPISMEEIEKVEIIRGPGSALYGANAMTGVVNIITRTPGDQPGQLISGDFGHPSLGRGTVMTNGGKGDTAYRLTAGYQQHGRWARNFDLSEESDLESQIPMLENQELGLQIIRANGRVDKYFGRQGLASVSAGATTGTFEFNNLGALPYYGINWSTNYVRGDISSGNLHLRTFWNAQQGSLGPWTEMVGQNQSLNNPVDNDAVDIELEGPMSFTTGGIDHTLNLGAGYRFKRVEFGKYLDDQIITENHYSVFINEQLSVGHFGAVVSMRVDAHPRLKLQETLSPRASMIYRVFDKTSVRATMGTAFRAPNSLESYMNFNLPNPNADGVFIHDVGDAKNLRPERIATYEVGLHDQSTFFHTADVVLYMNKVHDLIGLSEVDREISPFDTEANGFNFGETGWTNFDQKYTGTGVEAELEVYPVDGLDVYGNVDLQQVVVDDPSRAANADTLYDRSVSPLKLNVGTMYRAPFRMDFTYDLHFVSKQTWNLRGFDDDGGIEFVATELAPRTLMTIRVAGRPFADERLELAGTLWNMTQISNESQAGFIEHPEGQPIRGRYFGTATYKF